MPQKYRLTGETKEVDGTTVHRIISVCPDYGLPYGTLGGWVQGEQNLSQEGGCWVGGEAVVLGWGWVADNAHVTGNAYVKSSYISGSGAIQGNAEIRDSMVSGHSLISGNSKILDSRLHGAYITGDSDIRRSTIMTETPLEDASIYQSRHIIQITGWLPYDITVYRTKTGHTVRAGCQEFILTDDVERLATDAGYPKLPKHWETLRTFLTGVTRDWH